MQELRMRAEFEKILNNYTISKESKSLLDASRLTLLVGVSASGRDTIIHRLVEGGKFRHIASDTTRQPRINNGVQEKNGVEYWFRTEEEVLEDLKNGRLLEAEIIHNQQVSGISVREIEKCIQQDKIGITNVDLNIENIVVLKPDTHAILVVPPSFEAWMQRWHNRGEMPIEEKVRRYKTAERIFNAVPSWDFMDIVINDDLDEATQRIDRLSNGETQPEEQRTANMQTVMNLKSAIERELTQLEQM